MDVILQLDPRCFAADPLAVPHPWGVLSEGGRKEQREQRIVRLKNVEGDFLSVKIVLVQLHTQLLLPYRARFRKALDELKEILMKFGYGESTTDVVCIVAGLRVFRRSSMSNPPCFASGRFIKGR